MDHHWSDQVGAEYWQKQAAEGKRLDSIKALGFKRMVTGMFGSTPEMWQCNSCGCVCFAEATTLHSKVCPAKRRK